MPADLYSASLEFISKFWFQLNDKNISESFFTYKSISESPLHFSCLECFILGLYPLSISNPKTVTLWLNEFLLLFHFWQMLTCLLLIKNILFVCFTPHFLLGLKEDEAKHVLHLSLHQQLDFVRWNCANQDEVSVQSKFFWLLQI